MANDVFGKLKIIGRYGYDAFGNYGLMGTKSSKLASIEKDQKDVEKFQNNLAELLTIEKPNAEDQRKIKWYKEHIAIIEDRIAREKDRLSR